MDIQEALSALSEGSITFNEFCEQSNYESVKITVNSFGDNCVWRGNKFLGFYSYHDRDGVWLAYEAKIGCDPVPCLDENHAKAMVISFETRTVGLLTHQPKFKGVNDNG